MDETVWDDVMATNAVNSTRTTEDTLSSIIARLHAYTTAENLKFVNRDNEARAVLTNYIIPNMLSVVTGPRGCGKTELARALVYALRGLKDYVVVHVRYEESESIVRTLISSNIDLRRILKSIAGAIRVVELGIDIPKVISFLEILAGFIEEKIHAGKNVILIVDEVRGAPEKVRQALEVDADLVREYSRVFKTLKVLYLTSDATVASLIDIIGSKVGWYLLWNLPYDSFIELYKQLNPPKTIPAELIYNITGGNPREVLRIFRVYEWNLLEYIKSMTSTITRVLRQCMTCEKTSVESTLREARVFIEDLDMADAYRLWRYMLRNNIVTIVDVRLRKLTPVTKTPWFGEDNAFQLPVYYWILKTMVEHGSVSIEPRMVLETITSSLQAH